MPEVLAALIGWALGVLSTAFLGWYKRPILKLSFDSKEPWVRVTRLTSEKTGEWVRVMVKNDGRSPATACVPMVTRARRNETAVSIDPFQVRWAGVPRSRGFDPLNLPPNGEAFFNVLLTEQRENVARFETFQYPDFDPGFALQIDLGPTYTITVQVASDNGASAERSITFPRTAVMP